MSREFLINRVYRYQWRENIFVQNRISSYTYRSEASEAGYKQLTLIKDVEHDKHAQLKLVWIEVTGCLYPDTKKGAYEKCNDDGP